MIKDYQDLQQLVSSAGVIFSEQNPTYQFEFSQAENGACTLLEKKSGKKFVFMLAKLGAELKLGFAFYDANEPQPDWIDDVLASGSTTKTLCQLLESEFV
ncbi:hypothetical protein THMIRHAS_10600 [Thiosulfatimonas sediminis]|uniref:Uncharacterized protein n=1 Tax=Thiosulfatimonas sediminis TaxID=2675054 RepID=A0A6F8PUI2_9GAMM|nr:hypothetical protein [Thiosulfatimonas sediminis]BBP45687.1 hypothetical protein THMIRHAS_10600 [Thiosulfatimonas sediminis]